MLTPLNEKITNPEVASNLITVVTASQTNPSSPKEISQVIVCFFSVDEFYLDPAQRGATNNGAEMFLIVRSLKNKEGQQKGYELDLGDTLKLGRMEFKVIEMSDHEGKSVTIDDTTKAKEIPYFTEDVPTEALKVTNGEATKKTCRICLCDEIGDGDLAMLSPCRCKGSCEFVHRSCLVKWIENKVQLKKIGFATSYFWKKIECEICNDPLPRKMKLGLDEFEIFDVERPKGAYIILESLTKEKKAAKVLHVLGVDPNEPIKLVNNFRLCSFH